jgi:Putative Ig domain
MLLLKARTAVQVILLACFSVGLLSAQSLTITSSPILPPASVTISYPPATLTATGGSPPYTWTLVGVGLNGLPMGMTLSPGGVISGLPTSTGVFSPQIRVNDSGGNIATQQFSLTVAPAATLVSHAGVISQVAAGQGWDTTIYLVNTSSSTINSAIIAFHGDTGSPLFLAVTTSQQGYSQAITASSLTFVMNPATTIVIHTAASQTAALQQGWADIAATAGVGSYAIFRQTLPNGVVAEGTSAQQSSFQPSLIMPFDNTSNNVTTVGLVSLSTAPVTIAATIWDENGNPIGGPAPIVMLSPLGHTAFSIPAQFPATNGKRGFVRFDNSNTDGLSGIGFSFGSLLGGSFTSVPTLPPPPAM